MKKIILAIIFLLSSITAYSDTPVFTDNNTALAIQINVGKIYNDVVSSLLEVTDTNDPKIKERANEIFKTLAEKAPQFSEVKPETIATSIKNWKTNGTFIPNGFLQFSLSKDLNTYFILQAKIDIEALEKLLKMFAKESKEPFFKKEGDEIEIFKDKFSMHISKNGLFIGKIGNINKEKNWKNFEKIKNSNDVYGVVEANIKLIEKIMDSKKVNEITTDKSSFIGNAITTESIQSTKDKIKDLSRIRFVYREKTFTLAFNSKDKAVREEILQKLKDGIEDFKKNPAVKDAEKKEIKVPQIDFVDKEPWVGITVHNEISEMEPGTALLKFVKAYGEFIPFLFGLIQQFDFSNIDEKSFADSRKTSKLKACQSNMRVIEGAVEIYNMSNEKSPITEINTEDEFNVLIKEGYINKMTCPESNKFEYHVKVSDNGEKIEASCNIHGSLKSSSSSSSSSFSSPSSSFSTSSSMSFDFKLDESSKEYSEYEYNHGSYSSMSFGNDSMAKYGVGVIGIKPSNFGSSKFSPDWGPKDMDKDLDKKVGSCKSCMTIIRETAKAYAKDKYISDISKITFKELLNDKYLSAMPICPEKGKYEILPEYDVKCSVHENLSKFDK